MDRVAPSGLFVPDDDDIREDGVLAAKADDLGAVCEEVADDAVREGAVVEHESLRAARRVVGEETANATKEQPNNALRIIVFIKTPISLSSIFYHKKIEKKTLLCKIATVLISRRADMAELVDAQH